MDVTTVIDIDRIIKKLKSDVKILRNIKKIFKNATNRNFEKLWKIFC